MPSRPETARSDTAGKRAAGSRLTGRSRGERVRLVLAAVLGGLTVAFALLNTDDVEVDWIFGTFSTPLIVVIVLSLLIGALFGYALARRRQTGSGSARRGAAHRG